MIFEIPTNATGVAEWIGTLFYLVNPATSSFATLESVTDYTQNAFPLFLISIVLEWFFIAFFDKDQTLRPPVKDSKTVVINGVSYPPRRKTTWTLPRFNDMTTSLTAGVLQQLLNLLILKTIALDAYIYIHENHPIYQLDPTSVWTWVAGMLLVDLGYYWAHRMSHEMNIGWAAHIVHHSSEEYNLTTALRQSILQNYFSWAFYLPFAPFLPPATFLTHKHLNVSRPPPPVFVIFNQQPVA